MKPKKKTTANNLATKKKPAFEKKKNRFFDYIFWFFKNTIIGLFCYFLIFQCIDEQKDYKWVYYSLMKENLKTMQKYKKLSIEKKFNSKLGFNYSYWKYIHDNTPEDAVILYPTREICFPKDKETKLTGEATNKFIITRFLYPRKLVYPTEIETNRYGKEITHVAIANGWGYEYLEYNVGYQIDYAVLPIKQPENKDNQTINNDQNY